MTDVKILQFDNPNTMYEQHVMSIAKPSGHQNTKSKWVNSIGKPTEQTNASQTTNEAYGKTLTGSVKLLFQKIYNNQRLCLQIHKYKIQIQSNPRTPSKWCSWQCPINTEPGGDGEGGEGGGGGEGEGQQIQRQNRVRTSFQTKLQY